MARVKLKFRIALILLATLSACATGPGSEKKSKLNYLNGVHYASTTKFNNIPVTFKTKKVDTVIEGTILLTEYKPLQFAKLLLIQEGETVLETFSDSRGSFKFKGYLANGDYIIRTETGNLEKKITVDGYKVGGLLLKVEDKQT